MNDLGKSSRGWIRSTSKYINPCIDEGFKILFGTEKNKEFTMSLLSSIVGFEISELTFLNTEELPGTLGEKPIRYDILVTDGEKNKFLLEMQVRSHAGLLERTFYYMGRCLSSQLAEGEDYTNLKGVYSIFLTWFGNGDGSDSFIKDFRMVNVLNTEERFDNIRQIFINLKKFQTTEEDCNTLMEQWLYNLKNMNKTDRVAFADRNEVFRKLAEAASQANMTPDEKILYDLRADTWRDYYADLDESEAKGREQGREEGLRRGREEGREEGLKQGRDEGWKQGSEDERMKIAKAMKDSGMDSGQICKFTGLTVEQIESL